MGASGQEQRIPRPQAGEQHGLYPQGRAPDQQKARLRPVFGGKSFLKAGVGTRRLVKVVRGGELRGVVLPEGDAPHVAGHVETDAALAVLQHFFNVAQGFSSLLAVSPLPGYCTTGQAAPSV